MNRQSATRTRWKRCLGTGFLCLTTAAVLQACMPLMVARTGVSGAMVATDRRTMGVQIDDKTIGFKGESVADAIVGNQGHVNVTCFNGMVLLTGEVPNEGMKAKVEREIAKIPNVKRIVNELALDIPSGLNSRSSDALITAQVSARFLNEDGLFSNTRKTITERGTVYLMGLLTEKEGHTAAETARVVPGVQKVVKVFEYASEKEIQRVKSIYTPVMEAPRSSSNPYKTSQEYQ